MRVEKYFAVYTPSGFPLLQKLSNHTFQSFKYIQHRVHALTEFFSKKCQEQIIQFICMISNFINQHHDLEEVGDNGRTVETQKTLESSDGIGGL